MLAHLLASIVLCALPSSSFAQVGPTTTSLASFTTGPNGLFFTNGRMTGWSVAQVGDHNNDGIVDFAVGGQQTQSYNNGIYSGVVVLVLGNSSGWSADIDMTYVTSGDTIRKIYSYDSNLNLGSSVGGAGDVNLDGFDDLLVGASGVTVNGQSQSGAVIVIYGRAPPYTDVIFNASFLATGLGYTIYSTITYDNLAYTGPNARPLGDINGDDYDDFAISGQYVNYTARVRAGITAIIYGSPFPPTADLEIADLGSAGVLLGGGEDYAGLGSSIDGLGDFNGDGMWDIVIGAGDSSFTVDSVTRNGAGIVYVLFNTASLTSQDMGDFVTGEAGVRILGLEAGKVMGYAAAFAGDVNGDSLSDLILGAPYVSRGSLSNVGNAYVVFGTTVPFTADIDLLNFVPGTAGYKIIGSVDSQIVGYAVSRAGDMNSDGVDDFMVSARGTAVVYIVYGSTVVPTANLDLGAIPANTLYTISSAPTECIFGGWDVTGDGYPDVMMGTQYTEPFQAVLLKGPLPRSGTRAPTHEPTERPTAEPSAPPTSRPSQPSSVPSSQPSVQPSAVPSSRPSTEPSSVPSVRPSALPSSVPSVQPSAAPSSRPSAQPSSVPSVQPSAAPSSRPSAQPSSVPSVRPSTLPSGVPSVRPSGLPSGMPSSAPTSVPSVAPSLRPLAVPTATPLSVPTSRPSTLAPTVVVRTSSDRATTGHLSTGGIAGVVIGAVFLVLLLTTFALFFLAVRRGSDEQAAPPASPPAEGYEMTGV